MLSNKSKNQKVYIIAEAGVNHNGSLRRAKTMIKAAAAAGADAVKFQTFVPDEVISSHAPMASYQVKNVKNEASQLEMVRKLELDKEAHRELVRHARHNKIDFLSTPFDILSLEFLVYGLGLDTIKVPSGEITNAPLLVRVGSLANRVFLSTGMANISEIDSALGYLAAGHEGVKPTRYEVGFKKSRMKSSVRDWITDQVSLLHCTTEYPAPIDELNLGAIGEIRANFGTTVGFSDHSFGISAAPAAVALGARIIEKHFTLDRTLPGPDHKASLIPNELIEFVRQIREVEAALGSTKKAPTESELKNMPIARKSLVARQPIRKGDVFTEQNLGIKRPGNGVSPKMFWSYLGEKATRHYDTDDLIVARRRRSK